MPFVRDNVYAERDDNDNSMTHHPKRHDMADETYPTPRDSDTRKKTPAAQEAEYRQAQAAANEKLAAIGNGTPTETAKPKAKAPPTDQEWLTVRRVLGLLAGLPDDGARQRVVSYVASRFSS